MRKYLRYILLPVIFVAGCSLFPTPTPSPTPGPTPAPTPAPIPLPPAPDVTCLLQAAQACAITSAGNQAAFTTCMTAAAVKCGVPAPAAKSALGSR